MLNEAIFCVTCLATPLRDELQEPLQRVTPRSVAIKSLLDNFQASLLKVNTGSTFCSDFSYKFQVAGAIAPCSITCNNSVSTRLRKSKVFKYIWNIRRIRAARQTEYPTEVLKIAIVKILTKTLTRRTRGKIKKKNYDKSKPHLWYRKYNCFIRM